jgi:hypothetical protein
MAKKAVKKLPELKPVNYVDVVNPRMLTTWLSNKIAKDRWKEIVLDMSTGTEEDNYRLTMLPKNPKLFKNIDPITLGTVIKDYVDQVLSEWKDDSDDTAAKTLVASLPLFIEMSKVMPHVNPSDDYTYAFRGTEVAEDKLNQFIRSHPFEKDWKKVKVGGKTYYSYVGPKRSQFTYKPHRDAQSWSVSDRAASNFGSTIVVVPIDKTFFFDPGFMGQYGYTWENETIHFGKEPMKVALLVDDADYDNARGRGPWKDLDNPTFEDDPEQFLANEYYDGDLEMQKLDNEFHKFGRWTFYDDNEKKIMQIKQTKGRDAALAWMKGELEKLQKKEKLKESIMTETIEVMDDDGTLTLPL